MALCLALALLLLLIAPFMYAQTTSTIEGTVTDEQSAAVVGAQVTIANPALAISRQVTSDSAGFYRVAGLPPGEYTVTVGKSGFSLQRSSRLEVTVNRTLVMNVTLRVAAVATETTVEAVAPLLEPTASSTGGTITPTQIASMPINGRDYLDLMQLVPGVAINRQNATLRSTNANDPSSSDATTPVMGERAGNAVFLIDGMPNTDQVSGGAASQFNEDSILEFQVITAGYKAEFGHGSGGVINVISKSGTNQWHGGASFFHRNYVLDSSDVPHTDAPFLLRWDPSLQAGGPIIKDKIFFFGSAERIRESRELNFQYQPLTPDFVIADQQQYDKRNQTYDLRLRAKLDEQLGHHRFTQQMNWTNTQVTDYLPLSAFNETPSQRYNVNARHLILGFSDTATLGDQSNPFVLNAFIQYRGEPSLTQAAHPTAGLATTNWSMFDIPGDTTDPSNPLFGQNQILLGGYGSTPTLLDQKYWSSGVSIAKLIGRHSIKFGWDFENMDVDGMESTLLYNQLFATVPDYQTYGINDAGVYLYQAPSTLTTQDARIRLRNKYNGFYFQDDIKLFKTLTVNAGLRWDRDSRFPTDGNWAPRLGFAWSLTPKTVIRASGGMFYDHFRLGLARDIPAFGGANLQQVTYFSLPRLFYGNPSILLPVFAGGIGGGIGTPCATQNALGPAFCGAGLIPEDALNSVVASGHAPIPANAVVTQSNVQDLSGLTPQDFADAASAKIGEQQGYFSWDPLGHLGIAGVVDPYAIPYTVDPSFKVPFTVAYQAGIQRELTQNIVVSADYYHRSMRDILGIRTTNLAFESRIGNTRDFIPGTGTVPIEGFGPWYGGIYDGLVFSARKTMTNHFALEGSYTWTHAWDDVRAYTGSGSDRPSDSFVGVVPVVSEPQGTITEPGSSYLGEPCGGSNQSGPFLACNQNPVPQAGKFYNGPMLDKGPSDLALKHTFLVSGIVQLPWKFEFSSIFRVQGGFPFSRSSNSLIDIDGDKFTNSIDHKFGRNQFNAPKLTNVDIRAAKRFDLTERMKLNLYFEMFNLFNNANPAAVQPLANTTPAFGDVTEVLPGREGQVGLKFEF
ncbi:MAG TPA: TonB-dependent receptor [Terriglobales bacterium]|nr:TonB-dependent receptor [Terriglobales bacterium]